MGSMGTYHDEARIASNRQGFLEIKHMRNTQVYISIFPSSLSSKYNYMGAFLYINNVANQL